MGEKAEDLEMFDEAHWKKEVRDRLKRVEDLLEGLSQGIGIHVDTIKESLGRMEKKIDAIPKKKVDWTWSSLTAWTKKRNGELKAVEVEGDFVIVELEGFVPTPDYKRLCGIIRSLGGEFGESKRRFKFPRDFFPAGVKTEVEKIDEEKARS